MRHRGRRRLRTGENRPPPAARPPEPRAAGCVSADLCEPLRPSKKSRYVCRSHQNLCASRRRRRWRGFLSPRILCAKGGPDGGDGGRGGSVILRADTHTDNLTPFFYEPIVKAKNGDRGGGRQCFGKSAPDRIVPVPAGTIIYRLPDEDTTEEADPEVEHGDGATYVDFSKTPDGVAKPARNKKAPIDPDELEVIADLTEVGQEFILCAGGKGGPPVNGFPRMASLMRSAPRRTAAPNGKTLIP